LLGVAVVGCGLVSKVHFDALKKMESEGLVRLEATCDVIQERAENAGRQYGFKWHTVNYKDIIECKDVDAVWVLLPVGIHCKVSKDLMNAGKHVLIEKPMALNPEECNEMIDSMKRNNVVLAVGHVKRKNEAYRLAKEYVDKYVGPLYLMKSCERWCGANHFLMNLWRSDPRLGGGGIWMDIGCHYLDLFRYIAGEIKRIYLTCNMFPEDIMDQVKIYQRGWREKVKEAYRSFDEFERKISESTLEGNALSCVEFNSGAVGEIDVGWCTKTPEMYYERTEIFGMGGAIIIESPPFYESVSPKIRVYLEKEGNGWIEFPNLPHVTEAFYHQAKEFIGYIEKNDGHSAFEGKRALDLVQAGYLSYKKRHPVEV